MPPIMALQTAGDGFVDRNLPHNLFFNIADGTMGLFAMSFVSTTTILPVYVSHLTSSAVLIGMAPALESLGWYLPQIFVAPFIEGLARVKPVVMTVSLCERLLLLSVGLVILTFPAGSGGTNILPLLLFFTFFGLRMLVNGINAIPWQEMVARVIPMHHRGRLFASQRFFGGIAGLLGAVAAAETLKRFEYPLNYSLCFVFAFSAAMVSWVCLFQTREPIFRSTRAAHRVAGYWREMPSVLRHDRNFVSYLIGRAMGCLGSMAMAFFAVHAVQEFGLGDDQAAVFTAILLGSNILGSALWGWIGDKRGQKFVLEASSILYALALVVALLQNEVAPYYVVFLLVGLANAGFVISDLALVLEFVPPARRPTYMGIARGLLGPWIGFAPVLGGLLLASFGYQFLLIIGWVLSVVGLLMLAFWVKEPRMRHV